MQHKQQAQPTYLEEAVAHLAPALADQTQPVAAVEHARQHLALQALKQQQQQPRSVEFLNCQLHARHDVEAHDHVHMVPMSV